MTKQQPTQQIIFSLDKIYVKDLSLELPNAPKIFLNTAQPKVDLNLNCKSELLEVGVFQSIIHAVISAKIDEEQLFLIEIEQAGIFQIRNVNEQQLELIQNIECPNVLFPYLRETVSALTTKAGFMPVVLAPVNFAYLYQQKKQAAATVSHETIN